MMKILLFILLSIPALAQKFSKKEIADWQRRAKQVTIIRDTWGVPHVYGKTDADAVFGMLYVQCEDDFERVERNYINAMGRQAEVDGESLLYNDLRVRLFMDTTRASTVYQESPLWMKKLCQAFADGVNYYLYTHPGVKPKLLHRFQPWMPLMFSEGSIGGDIEKISLNKLKELYGKLPGDPKEEIGGDGADGEPGGSNGFAIAPGRSASGKALLLINPHTSFYFRTELQVSSEEGLNAYGAVTWGQFFVYQGFNAHCGWMHTSSAADVVDEYKEWIVKKQDSLFYRYGTTLKFLPPEKLVISYRNGNVLSKKEFTVYHTHHGPVIAQLAGKGKWISVKMMQEPLKALTQSFQRTKASGLDDFKKTMLLRTNSSNNTVYADDRGNIAYWHGNFMPRRDPQFDWSLPVDGSNPATEWKGLHTPEEMIQIENPANGWIQNCNSTPFTAAGENSPDRDKYPAYMAPDMQNERGIHAERVLKKESAFTLDKLIAAAYDSYLPAFEKLLPSLLEAYASAPRDSLKTNLAAPIQLLRDWDLRYSAASVPTTLAIAWAQKLRQDVAGEIPSGIDQLGSIEFLRTKTSSRQKMVALKEAIHDLDHFYGNWRQPWGDINRFQRLTGNIDQVFDDAQPSLAVPFTSSFWGSLASFASRRYPGTKKMYGSSGNSFVAVVEFGDKAMAKSVVTGGESSDPASTHFSDQASMYCAGQFKDIFFYKEDVGRHSGRTYHPGE